ncbi:hypothetical protein ONZ43_g2406 [Nemania bipapillata]|uniref:Uncharacterized protein n=1 Tax=Nemania bipapillata TaxID=110536 RepID=A0ACC2J130_9PEZI|nr:hypothetical protein ONZ43_g2406 [Nemania bipapillata]
MADQDGFERQGDAAPSRIHGGPHSGDQEQDEEQAQRGPEDDSKTRKAYNSVKAILRGEDTEPKRRHDPYPSTNLNDIECLRQSTSEGDNSEAEEMESTSQQGLRETTDRLEGKNGEKKGEKSATEAVAGTFDPREKRKAMKRKKRHGEGREVTDPITHLPIVIHDQTAKDLDSVPENEPEPGAHHTTATGIMGASKSEQTLQSEQEAIQRVHNGMKRVFPPPNFESMRKELATTYEQAIYIEVSIVGFLVALLFSLPTYWSPLEVFGRSDNNGAWVSQWRPMLALIVILGLGAMTIFGIGKWMNKRTNEIFDDETWDAARKEEQTIVKNDEELPESVHWLNSLIGSIWPLVNPDLFASLVDQIEDVMQASLPKAIKMVSVDDMGQGSESIRILGVRWLPTGAASQSVGSNGQLRKGNESSTSDRTDSQQSQDMKDGSGFKDNIKVSDNESPKQQEQEEIAFHEGMEAEEGDFINLELALAYRSRNSSKSLKVKSKNAHLYLKFYLPGGIAIPVWVELRGIILTLRLRLQLTPDPPFIELCTLTFLGQPKASISCMPLSKHSFSLTDVPLISSFVNSAIDAALAEYVAPKSLTLNLKDMLVGEDFKKDTTSIGVVWIFIKRATDFKQGDAGIGPIQGSSDAYVTVSWGKFGKPVASTRIAVGENSPSWHEYASILVTPEEVNAGEKLRLQLWDSDKWTADDDLGRVEVNLKDLMHNRETLNRIQNREDRFTGEDVEEDMPGCLTWSVGYFAKTRITKQQLEAQTFNENIRTKDDLKWHVSESAENKLREAGKSLDDEEVQQQKAQDYRELENSSLQIRKLQKEDTGDAGYQEDEDEQADDMPNGYCTIILNHKRIFKTRTKPKNSKPFFNAGTERFIRDWRDTEVIVSVRDAREREDDPLIGLVYLPFSQIFKERSQKMDIYSLVGGIGYGKVRISMVWRSAELKLPPHISGWDYGTLQIRGPVKPRDGLDHGLTSNRIKIRTNIGRVKLYPDDGVWKEKGKRRSEGLFMAVRKRYSSAMLIEFRQSKMGPDRTSAFAVLWLHEISDEEDEIKCLKVWRGNKESFRKAQTCCEFNGSGEKDELLGEIEVPIRFWRGLSGYHKSFAAQSKNRDMRNVMECLDTITDEGVADNDRHSNDEDSVSDDIDDENDEEIRRKKLRMHTNDDSTPPSSDDEDDCDTLDSSSLSNLSLSDFKKVKSVFRNPVDELTKVATTVIAPGHNDSEDGARDLRGQLRDYKDHHKQLHRKHRGIMQWRAAREVNHLGGKLTRLRGNVSGLFHHEDKDAGIETEV